LLGHISFKQKKGEVKVVSSGAHSGGEVEEGQNGTTTYEKVGEKGGRENATKIKGEDTNLMPHGFLLSLKTKHKKRKNKERKRSSSHGEGSERPKSNSIGRNVRPSKRRTRLSLRGNS